MVASQSHPWIVFNWEFTEHLRAPDWVLLGEAESKCHHIADEPLLPATRKKLHRVYLAKGALATTAIEGNTLSVEQVQMQIDGSLTLPISKQYLGQEVQNILDACNEMMEQIETGTLPPLSMELIMHFNAQVLANLEVEEPVAPGKIREHTVRVGERYLPPPASECRGLLQRLVDWLNEPLEYPGHALAAGILKAIVAHLYIAWIHPFGDGNGRTARIVELYLLFASGAPSAAVQLLSNHYNETRDEYYRQLDRASKRNEIAPFVRYALQGFVDGLREQLDFIRQQQIDVHWENYVYEVFRDDKSSFAERRRNLVFDISKEEAPIDVSHLRHISTRTVEAYYGKSERTLMRDVDLLVGMELLAREHGKVCARKDRMLERRPPARREANGD